MTSIDSDRSNGFSSIVRAESSQSIREILRSMLEQFQRLYLEFVCLAQKESSSDCALFCFGCLIVFNIKPRLARPANLIQIIKPYNKCPSNISQQEFRHVPALLYVQTLESCQLYKCCNRRLQLTDPFCMI